MQLYRQAFLLFTLNFLDAVLTLFWVRNDFATEGNHLMAVLLDVGDVPFLAVKIGIGAVAAFVIWKWSGLSVSRYGSAVALAVYSGVMVIHFFTGLSAFGVLSDTMIADVTNLSDSLLAFFV